MQLNKKNQLRRKVFIKNYLESFNLDIVSIFFKQYRIIQLQTY